MAARKSPASTKPRASRTRADVEKEFEEITEEVSETPPQDPKIKALVTERQASIRAATSGVLPTAVVTRVSGLQLELGKVLAGVQEQTLAELTTLNELREAVELEKAELERLHKIDVAAAAIDQLVAEHAEKKAELERQAAQEHAHRLEQAQAQKQEREREKNEYEYKKALERRAVEDAWKQARKEAEQHAAEQDASLRKAWAEREQLLISKEKEHASLVEQVAGFDGRLKKETDAAVAAACNALKRDYEHKAAIFLAESQANLKLKDQQIQSMATQLAAQSARIEKLEGQVENTKTTVSEIAQSALREAGSSRALAEVTSIAGRENGAPSGGARR